jgi:excisionase family DNA binding protein
LTTVTPQPTGNLLRATPDERGTLEALLHHLETMSGNGQAARLVGPDGETSEIPASALRALELIVRSFVLKRALTLVPHGRDLTTQEAAALLHVSRPHLVKLLDEGTIPHHKVGTHRRIRTEDVLDYRERRARTRREKLDELTRVSEELEGGYR